MGGGEHSNAGKLYASRSVLQKWKVSGTFGCRVAILWAGFISFLKRSSLFWYHPLPPLVQSPEAVSAVGKLSYNQLVEKIITCKHSRDTNLVTEGDGPALSSVGLRWRE